MAMKIEMIQRLDLGIQGEHNVRPIRIDCTSWLDQYPNGSVDLMHKRHGDEVPGLTGASFNRESKILTWTPTDYDTFYDGDGYAEIRLTEGTNVKMKKKALTLVHPCIVNDVGDELESGWQGFLEEVTLQKSKMGSQAEAWAVGKRNGVDVDEEDETYHNNSKYFADNMAEVKDEYVAEIEAAGEAAQALIPEDLDYYAPAADVNEIKGHFNNGVLKVENGGTGETSAESAANALINALPTAQNTPGDDDYYVCQYVNGGEVNTEYRRRKTSTIYTYIANKIMPNGYIPADKGGTGQTNLKDSTNALINALDAGTSIPTDNDYFVSQVRGGGTANTTFMRRPALYLWHYIKSKFMPDGYVPVDNGGTGVTTLAALKSSLGITTTSVTDYVSFSCQDGTISNKYVYRSGNMIHVAFVFTFNKTVSINSYVTISVSYTNNALAPISRTEGGGANNENIGLIDILPSPNRITFYTLKERTANQNFWLTITYMCVG